MKSIITGGAGFIGSHLADALVARGDEVIVIDNLSTGTARHLSNHIAADSLLLLTDDLLEDGWQDAFAGAQRVYHAAADPDVRASAGAAYEVFRQNTDATMRVLEAMRMHKVPELVFTSTSTVYGEATVIPTPETYAPMIPISIYAATKLADEAMISAYAATYGMKAWVFRFANIIGERSNHGVIWDFIHKLTDNPRELEILGDGKQTKSYLEVTACVEGILYAADHADDTFNFFNVGSDDWISVTDIADIIVEEMGLTDVTYQFTGGDRGWVGDVPKMQLGVEKMKALGWVPPVTSAESVHTAVRALLQEMA